MNSADITLATPIEHDGKKISSLKIRRPIVADMLAAQKVSTNEPERELNLIAVLTGLPRAAVEKLDMRDYMALQAIFQPAEKTRVFLQYDPARGYDLAENNRQVRLYEISDQLQALLPPGGGRPDAAAQAAGTAAAADIRIGDMLYLAPAPPPRQHTAAVKHDAPRKTETPLKSEAPLKPRAPIEEHPPC